MERETSMKSKRLSKKGLKCIDRSISSGDSENAKAGFWFFALYITKNEMERSESKGRDPNK